ncbi:Uncharacterised protein [Acinetobacter baumannii]|nr:Uncharacterised protein [Acinetobacter baumannii]
MRWVSAVYLKVATLQQTVISVLQVKHSLRTRIMTYMVMMVLREQLHEHMALYRKLTEILRSLMVLC